ncbi:hypothetical protein D623_10026578 [Myotis brandtii]|uniref:Uncharacterized protein n=1 Tax=Myotis brandtii TaxID=109478 RepID=S7MZK6_MYOBR|nr:hypothetical protein D623_10026578 [Myotis brandtii]
MATALRRFPICSSICRWSAHAQPQLAATRVPNRPQPSPTDPNSPPRSPTVPNRHQPSRWSPTVARPPSLLGRHRCGQEGGGELSLRTVKLESFSGPGLEPRSLMWHSKVMATNGMLQGLSSIRDRV